MFKADPRKREKNDYTKQMSPSKICKIKLKEKKKSTIIILYYIIYGLETMARRRRKTSTIIIHAICNGI